MSSYLAIAISAVSSFTVGWLLHWARTRGRLKRLQAECARKIRAAEEQLALERLRMEQRYQEAMENGGRSGPEPAFTLEAYRDANREGHLARPRSSAPDSATSRA